MAEQPPAAVAVALSLGAALIFALGVQFSRQGLDHADYRIGTPISICASALSFLILSPWFWPPPAWSWLSFAIFAAVGCTMPLISGRMAIAATQYMGPTISSSIASTSPLFAVAFGVLVLGERLDWLTAAAIAAIITGILVLYSGGREVKPWPTWAVVLPLGAALIRALAQGLTKIGYEGIPSPFVAGMTAYLVSATLCLAIAPVTMADPILRRQLQPWALWRLVQNRSGVRWFALAGCTNAFAIIVLYNALNIGALTVVAPTVATSPVFTLLLSAILFRREAITWRVIAGVTLVTPGVVAIAYTR